MTRGLMAAQCTHHQITGEPMKSLTLADLTGTVETDLFAETCRSYGLAMVRYSGARTTAKVEPFENSRGYSLRLSRPRPPSCTVI